MFIRQGRLLCTSSGHRSGTHGWNRFQSGRRGRNARSRSRGHFGRLDFGAVIGGAVFNIIKYAGAAYLIYLGIRTLLTKEKVAETKTVDEMSLRRTFSQAVFVNVLNPKTALFFFAFLPQFIDFERRSVAAQILVLGLIVVVGIGFTSGSFYSLLAGSVGNLFRGSLKFRRAQALFCRRRLY